MQDGTSCICVKQETKDMKVVLASVSRIGDTPISITVSIPESRTQQYDISKAILIKISNFP